MKPLKPIVWMIGVVLASPATAVPEVWVGTIPAHTTACTATAVDGTNSQAVAEAGQAFIDRWPPERLLDLGAVFGTDAETPNAIIFCAQYFGGDVPLPEGLVLRHVPSGQALFAYCQRHEIEACQARLAEVLGETWHGERWLRSHFGWVKPGRETPETIPARAELERLVVERDPLLTLPDAESDLQPVGQLTVARLTEEDANRIRAKLTQPSIAPHPEDPLEPPPPVEQP